MADANKTFHSELKNNFYHHLLLSHSKDANILLGSNTKSCVRQNHIENISLKC